MEYKKTVSVVICTYNGEKYIAEQIDSILSQTYTLNEIIIQDDCSTDNTFNILERYSNKNNRIKIFRNDKNIGFNSNFKSAVKRAKSDFIAIADQDDIWYSEKIAKQVTAIGDHDICFCCHNRGWTQEKSVYVTPQYSLEALLFTGFAGHTMLLRREFAQNSKNWIDYIHYDWSLAINAQLCNGIIRINEPLNWHRTHSESAIALENKSHGIDTPSIPKIKPYLNGYSNYRRLQNKQNWQTLYTYIYNNSEKYQPLSHKMAKLMLDKNIISLIKLCVLCAKHRKTIYYNEASNGIIGLFRSFFYPFIFAYNNIQYDL